jgi:hypothetical protein
MKYTNDARYLWVKFSACGGEAHFSVYFRRDIYGVKDIGEILDFLCKPIPFCRYCKIKAWEVGVEWSVSKKRLTEWIYPE